MSVLLFIIRLRIEGFFFLFERTRCREKKNAFIYRTFQKKNHSSRKKIKTRWRCPRKWRPFYPVTGATTFMQTRFINAATVMASAKRVWIIWFVIRVTVLCVTARCCPMADSFEISVLKRWPIWSPSPAGTSSYAKKWGIYRCSVCVFFFFIFSNACGFNGVRSARKKHAPECSKLRIECVIDFCEASWYGEIPQLKGHLKTVHKVQFLRFKKQPTPFVFNVDAVPITFITFPEIDLCVKMKRNSRQQVQIACIIVTDDLCPGRVTATMKPEPKQIREQLKERKGGYGVTINFLIQSAREWSIEPRWSHPSEDFEDGPRLSISFNKRSRRQRDMTHQGPSKKAKIEE